MHPHLHREKKKKKSFRKDTHNGPAHGTPIGHRTAHPAQRTWDRPRAKKAGCLPNLQQTVTYFRGILPS
jgi:hypothetical protein